MTFKMSSSFSSSLPLVSSTVILLSSFLTVSSSSSPSLPYYCGITMNDTTGIYAYSHINNRTGIVTNELSLPLLDSYGMGISSGVNKQGLYFTVSGNVSEEELIFIVDTVNHRSYYRKIVLPSAYEDWTIYGVGSINIDPVSSNPVLMMLGYGSNGERYSFLGILNPATGTFTSLLYNLTDSYRGWIYLYAGITALDPVRTMYYVSVVIDEQHDATLVGYNYSLPTEQNPVLTVPFNGLGDYMALGITDVFNNTNQVIALVDDDSNTGAAVWLLDTVGSSSSRRRSSSNGSDGNYTWRSIYQYPPNTLESGGNNNFELTNDYAYSVFYDNHYPIANQIVSVVGLHEGKEILRTIIQGSENGTASIADLVICPSIA